MILLHSFILGIVEGITEFLPISSTGHLILASELLKIPPSEFLKSFEITIQLGAIAAVVVYYFKEFFNIETLKKLAVGFIPTGIIGLLLYKILKTYLLGNSYIVLSMLFLGGIALIVFELLHTENESTPQGIEHIGYRQSLIVGLFQSIAIIPGVSRSAATILGGLLVGIPRATIVEFSFLLAVPTMAAATGLDLLKNAAAFSGANVLPLAVGFITSFVVALLSITFLLAFTRKHTFIPFGIYRIAVAIAFWLLVLR
ncbi:MAG: undecaprenyl-diphosphatase UppP [Candidatus Paceibacterota bacterium]